MACSPFSFPGTVGWQLLRVEARSAALLSRLAFQALKQSEETFPKGGSHLLCVEPCVLGM